jgi:hypothetical protein
MKITNIANDRFKGGHFYSSENYHPETCHLPVEPWIAGQHLRLDEEIVVSDEYYFSDKDNLEDYKRHRIIDFIVPVFKEKIIEVVIPTVKPTEKVLVLENDVEEVVEETITVVEPVKETVVKEVVETVVEAAKEPEIIKEVKIEPKMASKPAVNNFIKKGKR